MIGETVKSLLKKINWAAVLASPVFWIAVGSLFLFIAVGFWFDSCRTRNREEKKSEINANIIREQIEGNILTNQKTNLNANLKEANRISQNTLENINAATGRGLNAQSNNFDETLRRYCAKYPHDEGCQ